MIDTLNKTLKHMEDNSLPCAEIKLAIYLLENEVEDNDKCDKCKNFAKCQKSFVGGKGLMCQWFPTRFEHK